MSGNSLALLYIDGLRDIQVTQYSRTASSIIVLYDYLITLDKEIDLIWGSRWTLPKILVLLNRYYVLLATVFGSYAFFSPALTESLSVFLGYLLYLSFIQTGSRYFFWEGFTGLAGSMLAQAILQIRIYALYSLNKKILVFMLACYLSFSVASAWVMGTGLASATESVVPIPGGKFCVLANFPLNFYTYWIPLLLFDSMLCTMALVRGLQEYKSERFLFRRGRTLFEILIRDSVLFYLAIAISYLTCLLLWRFGPQGLLDTPTGFATAMSCVLANRVLFNLREANRDTSPMSITTQEV